MTLADKLRPYVVALKTAAEKGDGGARQVINLYQMHVRCPSDPAAPALCEATFDDWRRKNNEEPDDGN